MSRLNSTNVFQPNARIYVRMENKNQYPRARIHPGLAGLTEERIRAARKHAAEKNISLRRSILDLALLTETQLLTAVADETQIPFLNLAPEHMEKPAIEALSANAASHYKAAPLRIRDRTFFLAIADPFDRNIKPEIELLLDNSLNVQFALATSHDIEEAIRKAYGVAAETIERMVNNESLENTAPKTDNLTDHTKAHDASVIKLVNQILADAIASGATDIHLEPYENRLKARYRIDSMLHDVTLPPTVKFFREGITSRIKIMSGLDIAEKRLPQDGRAQVNLADQRYDLRISVLPTRYGQALNIRILPQSTLISDLASLGMAEEQAKKLEQLIHRPHGIILVTGPTGSGKTTTLYACMNMLKHTNRKIITIEDPIEYDMPGLVQMQVHPEIGFTFARALRSMLRHDPDIMLVGEIRDLETAQTAIRTALTGHLVFSTLHTNNAATAITRLLDMTIEPFLAASSIDAILAQRLVRLICPDCKQPAKPPPQITAAIKSLTNLETLPQTCRGKGCPKCRFTGYHSRTIITELLLFSEKIREMTTKRATANQIHAQAKTEGMTTLFQNAIKKAHQQITTYEEALRVTKGLTTITNNK